MTDAAVLGTPFNSALETGVRALTVLVEAHPAALDLQQLVTLTISLCIRRTQEARESASEYTFRNGELLVRRSLIERAFCDGQQRAD